MQTLVDQATWLSARKELLRQEKELTQLQAAVALKRRQLPMRIIEEDYVFQTNGGPRSLAELFQSSRQLIVYHFMFGADWEQGCPSCSFWADSFNGITPHLAARNTRLIVSSNAPLIKLNAYQKRLNWGFEWVSAEHSSFSQDFGVTFDKENQVSSQKGYNYGDTFHSEELPGISVFYRMDDGSVAHSYSCYARGLEVANPSYQLLDLTPMGRDEAELDYPMAWVKRNDEY